MASQTALFVFCLFFFVAATAAEPRRKGKLCKYLKHNFSDFYFLTSMSGSSSSLSDCHVSPSWWYSKLFLTEHYVPLFSFPNDPCPGTNSRNGTCYTAAECSSRGGTNSGSCANSFGVCCTCKHIASTSSNIFTLWLHFSYCHLRWNEQWKLHLLYSTHHRFGWHL